MLYHTSEGIVSRQIQVLAVDWYLDSKIGISKQYSTVFSRDPGYVVRAARNVFKNHPKAI